jgi:transcriptional regulator with XRE-family HTH domain
MTRVQLRAARKRLGMTQVEFAAALGFSDAMSISRKERGVSKISPQLARHVALLLGCEVGE